jgi:hypothetical protein
MIVQFFVFIELFVFVNRHTLHQVDVAFVGLERPVGHNYEEGEEYQERYQGEYPHSGDFFEIIDEFHSCTVI